MPKENIKEQSIEIKQEGLKEPDIIEFYLNSDGKLTDRPKEWVYKKDKVGNPIFEEPFGVNPKDVIRFPDSDGNWRGGNPDEELLAEIRKWRHEWM